MKKLLLIVGFMSAGFMSAKDNSKNLQISSEITNEKKINLYVNNYYNAEMAVMLYDWITVTSSCGKVYYLDANDYSDTDELISDVNKFDKAKCG